MTGEKAARLAKCFSKGVIKVAKDKEGREHARVADPRKDTCSREVFRHEVREGGWGESCGYSLSSGLLAD